VSRKIIGGVLLYELLAQQHRPRDDGALAAECRRLVSTGLTPRDVATALRLELADVLMWIDNAGSKG
jgi:hypothetical protein